MKTMLSLFAGAAGIVPGIPPLAVVVQAGHRDHHHFRHGGGLSHVQLQSRDPVG